MTRKQFTPTEKQLAKWNSLTAPVMPSDEEFKAMWKKAHHGKEAGWGLGKRDWVALHENDNLTYTVEYNLGLWQGRVDAANGLEPMDTTEYHTNPYHYGYYAGYNGFASFWKGYDKNARASFEAEYVEK
jgi:hypothetical protein